MHEKLIHRPEGRENLVAGLMNGMERGLDALPANCPAGTAVPGATIGKMFLTVAEAASRLGMTPSWIYERTRRKAIPHRKLGKFVRFTEEDLQAIADAAATGILQ
jgi:excisionase family DNA binding protein